MKEIKSIEEFNELVRQDRPVLIDFYADWCGPCQALTPIVERLAEKYEEDMEIVKINVDTQQAIAQRFEVRSIPTLFFVHELKIKEKLIGLQLESALEDSIQKYTQLSA
ncbi:MAG: thioredoxin [Aureispira sp.]